MASRKLGDLDYRLQPLAETFLAKCAHAGIDILVTCTWRSAKEQDKLYAQGRTEPGKIVTNAKAGQSKHNLTNASLQPAAQAFDVVPLRSGKPIWNASDPVWLKVGEIGESVGLEWAGRWKRFKEYPHFQLPS